MVETFLTFTTTTGDNREKQGERTHKFFCDQINIHTIL